LHRIKGQAKSQKPKHNYDAWLSVYIFLASAAPVNFVYNFSILAAAGRPQKGLQIHWERCKKAKTKRENGQQYRQGVVCGFRLACPKL